jgi:ATPase subunit of ABC transporter with duplicated ATPase domains
LSYWGDLEPSAGNVSKDPHERLGKLKQDQFAYEEFTVLDTVIMGHEALWSVKSERDAIYAKYQAQKKVLVLAIHVISIQEQLHS